MSNHDSKAFVKNYMSNLSESELNAFFKSGSCLCETHSQYMEFVDVVKEVCVANDYDIDKVITFKNKKDLTS